MDLDILSTSAKLSEPNEERKRIIRDHNICFRCCETSNHFTNRYKAKVSCDVCGSSYHCIALHDDVSNRQILQNSSTVLNHGEKDYSPSNVVKQSITSKCTDICCKFSGKS